MKLEQPDWYLPAYEYGTEWYLPAYEDGTVCSETSAYKIQTQGNYPEENIQTQTLLTVIFMWYTLCLYFQKKKVSIYLILCLV